MLNWERVQIAFLLLIADTHNERWHPLLLQIPCCYGTCEELPMVTASQSEITSCTRLAWTFKQPWISLAGNSVNLRSHRSWSLHREFAPILTIKMMTILATTDFQLSVSLLFLSMCCCLESLSWVSAGESPSQTQLNRETSTVSLN